MFTSADEAAIAAIVETHIIGDRPLTVVLRRKVNGVQTTLAEQTFRVERRGGGSRERDGEFVDETQGDVVIIGLTSADIALGDRFNLASGELVEVTYIRPNRETHIQAEGKVQT